ncbi:MAG: M28 family peptidase, partial [Planctomycetia bacterium]|nr:M28 family peptidase [Planctomycetia bacterium]
MSTRSFLFALAFWMSCTVATRGENPAPRVGGRTETDPDPVATTRRILAEVDARSELMANLEYLCDRIGPRMTGSGKLKTAGEWTRAKFEAYGLEHARLEPWRIAHAWTRGDASGRVVEPAEQRLMVESAGWSRGTKGPVRGPVVLAEGDEPADVAAYRGRLKGAWIILDPYEPLLPEARLAKLALRAKADPPDFTDATGYPAFRRAFEALMIAEGAAGLLIDAGKEHGLFPIYGGGDFFKTIPGDDFAPTPLPVAFLSSESYGLVWRLRTHGPVEVELDLSNAFSPGPVEVYNTVAELVGAERPDEYVILGAHLDSWDLGTGATDNGTGCMAV